MNLKGFKGSFIIFHFLIIVFITGCYIDSEIDNSGVPIINEINPDKVSLGDYIYIYGKYFGVKSDSNFIVFDDTIFICSKDCDKWNNSLISLKLPKRVKKGYIYVIVNGVKSNVKNIEVMPIPDLNLVRIEAGEFYMGSENGMPNESPVHRVIITKPFFISKYEVTQRLWEIVMGYNPSPIVGENFPVCNVSWKEAIVFCNKLSEIEDLEPYYVIDSLNVTINNKSNGYRLPTEAEWEYACRAGTNDDILGANSIFDICWFSDNSGFRPMPIGTKKANNWGLYDMIGNAWEWCWDYYDENYYSISPLADPTGPENGVRRVLRGGSYKNGKEFARPSNRNYPDTTFETCGLRIVREIK